MRSRTQPPSAICMSSAAPTCPSLTRLEEIIPRLPAFGASLYVQGACGLLRCAGSDSHEIQGPGPGLFKHLP